MQVQKPPDDSSLHRTQYWKIILFGEPRSGGSAIDMA